MAAHAYPIHSIRLRAELAPEQLAAALSVSDEKATLRGVTACFLYIMTATPHQTCLKELERDHADNAGRGASICILKLFVSSQYKSMCLQRLVPGDL